MSQPANPQWFRMTLLFAIVYALVGITFAALAGSSVPRLAAWFVSAATFAIHLGYEHFRLRSSPARAALHAAVAVALGAFALAVWVNVHSYRAASGHRSPLMPLALVAFPVVTGVPAFVVGLIAVSILARTRPL
jgi:hypothetical protein